MTDDTLAGGSGTANDATIVTEDNVAPVPPEVLDGETPDEAQERANEEARVARLAADREQRQREVDGLKEKEAKLEAHLEGTRQALEDAEAELAALEGVS